LIHYDLTIVLADEVIVVIDQRAGNTRADFISGLQANGPRPMHAPK
jgi:hypothetical protein